MNEMTEGEKRPWYTESKYFEQNLRQVLPERRALYGPEDNMVKLGEQLMEKPPSEVANTLKSWGWNAEWTEAMLTALWVTAKVLKSENGKSFLRVVDGFVVDEKGWRSPILTDVYWD